MVVAAGTDDEPSVPAWMAKIDELGPVAAFGLGVALKAWLIDNNAAVMAVLFVVFAVSLIGDAIQILA